MRLSRSRLMLSGLAVAGALALGACSSGADDTSSAESSTAAAVVVNDVVLPEFGPEVEISVQDAGAVLVGQPGARTTIDIFVDPLCPACAKFDAAYGPELDKAIAAGDLAVRYHTLNFLAERSASGDYSTRAAAAGLCVAQGDAAAAQFVGFHSALFDAQPRMGGDQDLSNVQLTAMAVSAGAGEQVFDCVPSGAALEQAEAAAAASSELLASNNDGKVSTPSVLAGDEVVDISNPDWISVLIG